MNNKIKAETWEILQLMFEKFEYNDHQLHFQATFEGKINEQALLNSIKLSIKSLPLLNCRYIDKSPYPYWTKDDFNIQDYFKVKRVLSDDLNKDCAENITYCTNAQNGPQIHVTLIKGLTHDAICISLNHQLCDATGFQQYLWDLSNIYSQMLKNPDYQPPLNSYSRGLSQILKNFTEEEIKGISESTEGEIKTKDVVTFDFKGDKNRPFIVSHKLSPTRLKAMKAIAKPIGATVNDILFAALFRSLYKTMPENKITTLPCPIDLRKYYLPKDFKTGICNLNSFITCSITSSLDDSFTETLAKVKQAMDLQKKSSISLKGTILMEQIFQTMEYEEAYNLIAKSFSNPLISLTNIGIIDDQKLHFEGAEITETFISGSIKFKPYFQIGTTTFKDEMTLTVNLYGTVEDELKIKNFLMIMDNELP